MLISLTTWAERSFERPPTLRTLRAWAASGSISGAVKVGRTWMVGEDSVYIGRPVSVPSNASSRVAEILLNAA